MKFFIEEKLANAILNYLVNRPYIEVSSLIMGLHKLIPVVDANEIQETPTTNEK